MGWLYQNGQGVQQNYNEAAKWFRMAAEQGNAYAQSKLGVLYFKGKGVSKNYVHSHLWINLAASQDENESYESMLDLVDELMTPEQIAEAQRLANLWEPGLSLDDLK